MEIRRFKISDAEQVAKMIGRNFLEVNIKDYSLEAMQKLAEIYNKDKVIKIASVANTYVAVKTDIVVGTGSIRSFWGSETESCFCTIFVLPEYHGKGIGKKIVEALELDDMFLKSTRIEIPASITACGFYEKMGYSYKNNVKKVDDEGHYLMEKIR